MKATRRLKSVLLTASFICWAAPCSSAQCLTLAINQPEELKSGYALAIRLLPINNRLSDSQIRYQYRVEPLETIHTALAAALQKNLQDSGLFRSIVLTDQDTAQMDLVLQVEITEVAQGTRVVPVPITPLGEPTTLEIIGELRPRNSQSPILEFACRRETYGPIFVNRPKDWMHHSVDLMGRDLTKELLKATAYTNARPPLNQPSITASYAVASEGGATIYALAVPPTKWHKLNDANRQGLVRAEVQKHLKGLSIPILSAASKPAESGTVAALWITAKNVEDLRYLQAQKNNQSRSLSVSRATRDLGSEDPLLSNPREIYKQVAAGELLILQVWFAKQGATIWDTERMKQVTTIRNLKHPTEYVWPARTVNSAAYLSRWVSGDNWVYNSVMFLFAGKQSDGARIIDASVNTIEVRTELDRREVIIQVNQ